MQAVFFEGNRTLRVGGCVAVEPGAGRVQIRLRTAASAAPISTSFTVPWRTA